MANDLSAAISLAVSLILLSTNQRASQFTDKPIKGKLIPIDTETEPEIIKLAESNSEAYALPMRHKEEVSDLTELSNRPSLSIKSSILSKVAESELSRRQRNGFVPVGPWTP